MDAFVLDCHPDPTRNEMVLWLKAARTGEVVAHREPFAPTFHVASRTGPHALERVQRKLACIPQVELDMVDKRLGLDHQPTRVLRVRVHTPGTFRHIARTVDKLGQHRRLDLYDVDLRISHQYLLSRDLFPFARVAYDGQAVTLQDHQWALDYQPPELTKAKLEAQPATPEGNVPSHQDPLAQATL
ncbi:MAG: hypothetical protein R3185_08730, partial [Candidatus Thermoplasmatota archaeon]|nr:hypothetical protein [Candidatus Thermoplasmatota archaeon]